MSRQSMNPIAVRSRKWIIDALLELMKEKPYSAITISEIAKKADLVRRTFYRNFNNKEEILEAYFQSMIQDYLDELPEEGEVSTYTLALIYFKFWKKKVEFIRILQHNNLFHILLREFDDFVPKVMHRYKKSVVGSYSETYFRYYTAFVAAGLWHMLERWVAEGMIETPEKMAEMYIEIIGREKS